MYLQSTLCFVGGIAYVQMYIRAESVDARVCTWGEKNMGVLLCHPSLYFLGTVLSLNLD